MKTQIWPHIGLMISAILLSVIVGSRPAHAAPEQVFGSGTCLQVTAAEIPIGDFSVQHKFPLEPIRFTQAYNNQVGHNGIDLGGQHYGHVVGEEEIRNVLDGKVIVSYQEQDTNGWGNSILVASRADDFSQEIITTHYHHLHLRYAAACDTVQPGDLLGLEGETGYDVGGAHLHFTIRRWKNLTSLLNTIQYDGVFKTFGSAGYGAHDGAHLQGHLDPEGLLYHTFTDYQEDAHYLWSTEFVNAMRSEGVEFGLFDGRYGAGKKIARREAARWIKIAAQQPDYSGSAVSFDDVPSADADFPYIQVLTTYPSTIPVVDPEHTCVEGASRFCPDTTITRAAALKMVVIALYHQSFLELYDSAIWRSSVSAALGLLTQFQDVDPHAWYAPYIYFGTTIGLVADQPNFKPGGAIKREELAKWIIKGREHLHGPLSTACSTIVCPQGQYCSPIDSTCQPIPTCVPTEGEQCEVGGGYTPTSCTLGETTDCGNCGIMTCESSGEYGACQGQGPCAPGETQSQSCSGGTGTQQRTCTSSCQWGSWGSCTSDQPPCECTSGICCDGCHFKSSSSSCDSWYTYRCQGSSPGQDAQHAEVIQYCSAYSSSCNGPTEQSSWQTLDDCSSSEVCQMTGGYPKCMSSCQDTYIASSSSACYSNPGAAGSPTICLEANHVNGPTWEYRICKQQGVFQFNYTYRLQDDNHQVWFGEHSGFPGQACTPWRMVDLSYIPGYGASQGAGLKGYISSPAGCTTSECQYTTGYITVRLECQ